MYLYCTCLKSSKLVTSNALQFTVKKRKKDIWENVGTDLTSGSF